MNQTNYGKHYDRVHALWECAALGYNIRGRWRRRHIKEYIYLTQQKHDPIGVSLGAQCDKYYKLLIYLKDNLHSP